jgi:soluble lytic murein transglycosylase-like protein
VQRKLHRPVIFAPTRGFARSFRPLSISLLALGLTSLPVAGVNLVPQETLVRPPLQSASLTTLAARGAVPFPAIPAAGEDAKPEPRLEPRPPTPPIPAETTRPAAPEALRPATVPEAPKPQATVPAPAPAAITLPPTPVPPPAAAASALSTVDQLRKAADMLIEVNTALGAPRSPYGQIIYDIAVRHSINPQLVAALIHVESAFNPRAVSRKGAYGLMQLLPSTGRRFGVNRKRDLLNPVKNLEAGVSYLKWLTERFGGDMQKSLAAYNAGEGAVDRFGGIPPYHETQQYVQRIFGLLGIVMPDPPAAPAPTPPAPAGAAAAPLDIVPAGR